MTCKARGKRVRMAALYVAWLERFRWGSVLDYDEASYLAVALQLLWLKR